MTRFILLRLSSALFTMALLLAIVFVLTRIAGDPVLKLVPPFAPPEEFQRVRHELGLDRPALVQFGDFLEDAIQGDFGDSLWQKRDVLGLVMDRLPATILLAASGSAIALLVGVPLGVMAAARPNSLLDRIVLTLSVGAISVPYFWLGLLLIIIFPVKLGLFYTSGYGSWQHLVLPAVTVAALPLGRLAQVVRSELLDVLHQDYIRTAYSKGLIERVVILRHGLRNAGLPIITLSGWELARFLGGAMVVVETVFAWPGVGFLTIQAIQRSDYPLVLGAVFVQGSLIVLVNMVVDVAYTFVDPRIRLAQ